MRRRTLGTALAVTVTMAAAACGGSDARPDRPDRGDAEEFSVVSALVQLPATDGDGLVARGLLHAVRRDGPELHDDLDLAYALGPGRVVRFCPSLTVGVHPMLRAVPPGSSPAPWSGAAGWGP
jgi:hypothetical protein